MSTQKYGFIYIWFDVKKEMFYIGSHWGTEDDGYICSSKWMRDAFRYRPHDFRRKVIKRMYECTRQELYVEEQHWLSMIKPHQIKHRYYNLQLSVKDPWYQYEQKRMTIGEKISASKKGKSTGPCSPEKARKISETKKAKFASGETKITDEWREKNSLARKGKPSVFKRRKHTEETKKKIGEAGRGRKQSPETIAKKIAKTTGQKRTEESRKKMSQSSSMKFLITRNAQTFEVLGLKQYSRDSGIPYITLHKAYKTQSPISKYNIQEIKIA